jgi:hypothetical protein
MGWHGAQKEPTKPKAKNDNAHSSARKRAILRGTTVLEGAKRRTSTPEELTEDPETMPSATNCQARSKQLPLH